MKELPPNELVAYTTFDCSSEQSMRRRVQVIDATRELNLSRGDSKFKVFLGLPFNSIAT